MFKPLSRDKSERYDFRGIVARVALPSMETDPLALARRRSRLEAILSFARD